MAAPLSPDHRIALRWLIEGAQLWLHNFGLANEVLLHAGNRVQRVAKADFDALLRDGLIAPVLTSSGSTVYEITDVWRERLQKA